MPDLGQYAIEVLSAYAASILLLLVIVIASVWKARRVLRRLSDVEERRGKTP
ncbi:heme exporter protein CcmD [Roseicyclus sediminis]|jgi:heme exporter protein D|uniref:heme exporter protein CcmD n=1 Tax=Roseicyclus sediminis TaxID=2980997 RepID=UPI003872FCA1